MGTILAVTLPFFALILLGHQGAARRLLPVAAIPGMNAYVLFFALPCLLFRFGASRPFGRLIDPTLIGVYAVAAVGIVAMTIVSTVRRGAAGPGVGLPDAAFGALVAAFPNSGFMGVPLLVALFGPAAAGPVIGTLLVDLFLTCTLCLGAGAANHRPGAGSAEAGGPGREGWAPTAWRALRGALANPQPWAIAFGASLAASGRVLPGPVERIVAMLADSATPVALFTIGAVLWRAGQHADHRTPLRRYLPLALVKLFVHPALVGGLGLGAQALGLPVPRFGLAVLVLTAALPSASNVSVLAERYGVDNGRVARIIMASTLIAVGSFSALAWAIEGVTR